MENQELQLLKNFENDSKWFHENMDTLRDKNFTGKFVAIKESKPIAASESLDVVINDISKKGENPSFIFIEFVHPKGFTLLL